MSVTINFDMDGTIANFYGVENWLDYLNNSDPTPYRIAQPLVRMASLARVLNRLQKEGYRLAIVSWLSKTSTTDFDAKVAEAKKAWLKKHLASVKWDEIHIIPYGTPKENYSHSPLDILFDDEVQNRENWTGQAFDVKNIIEILKTL